MNDLKRMIYGDEYYDRLEIFEKRLQEIEAKYAYWFENREDISTGRQPDNLANHYFMIEELPNVSFGFENESDLPKEIKDECLTEFNKFINPNP